jgi:hypothetical protein
VEGDPEDEAPYAGEDEEVSDATAAYAEYAAEEDEQDPDTTAAWPAEADDETGPDDETAPEDEQPAGDDAGPQTVELEALPGGNAEDQPAEPEPKRD